MAPTSSSRAAEKHPESTAALVSSLVALRASDPKSVRPTVQIYPPSVYAPGEDDKGEGPSKNRERHITSWKMTEHMYKSANNRFPTLARGLFIEKVEVGDGVPDGAAACEGDWNGEDRQRIVARGYDKFFNVGEVDWTEWEAMKTHTSGPYRLTLKSNGCLILISALTERHLLVASKHSLGTVTEGSQALELAKGVDGLKISNESSDPKGKKGDKAGADQSPVGEEAEAQAHAEVGRRWLRKTLRAKGKTESELAKRLWDSNSTAVFELCDDSFEEHVIATPDYWTGLHLHGLNHNTPHFSTAPPADVSSLATEFGFIPTKYVEVATVDEVKTFTDKVAKTGSWEGDMIEGFVVRATVEAAEGTGKTPYRPGAPFFFKVKFEEPYLLYRQWRELTRVMLPLLEDPDDKKKEAIWKSIGKKVQRKETAVYADWCAETMRSNPALFDDYARGIVRVREKFLEWTEGEGAQAWKAAKEGTYKFKGNRSKPATAPSPTVDDSTKRNKYIVVPVAVPGCGKTLIGVALSRLFGFGHTQSDDVTAKKTAATFCRNIVDLFKTHDVVYADRNNHIDKHYDELSTLPSHQAFKKALKDYNVRLIAIVWDVQSQPYQRMLRVCSERVVKRGDNHQTLRPDLTAEAEHEAVVGGFLRRWTPPSPETFDKVITVPVEQSPKDTLRQVVDGLVPVLGLSTPSDAELDQALLAATEYTPLTPYRAPSSREGKSVRYFGIAPEIDLPATLSTIITSSDAYPSARSLFDHLTKVASITTKPHITLAHNSAVEAEIAAGQGSNGPVQTLWNSCKVLSQLPISPLYEFDISHLVWDDRVMALAVENVRARPEVDAPQLAIPYTTSLCLHITVGTRETSISAFEARAVVHAARQAMLKGTNECETQEVVSGGGKVRWIPVDGITSQGRVRGMY